MVLFPQPVRLHLQLANLLIEFLHQLLLLALTPSRSATLEDVRARVRKLAFPLRDLHRVHAELTRQFVERLLALGRFNGNLRFELAAMPPPWPACRVLGSPSLNAPPSRILLTLDSLLL
jgi:hypothetical protein